jgi:hypothetical protein
MANEPFPLHELLHGSLYYPSSGFDGDPVRHLAGNILSFVYVDYGHSHDEFVSALETPGFRGYNLIAARSVTESELTPNGWRHTLPTRSDGDPTGSRSRFALGRYFSVVRMFQTVTDHPGLACSIFARTAWLHFRRSMSQILRFQRLSP